MQPAEQKDPPYLKKEPTRQDVAKQADALKQLQSVVTHGIAHQEEDKATKRRQKQAPQSAEQQPPDVDILKQLQSVIAPGITITITSEKPQAQTRKLDPAIVMMAKKETEIKKTPTLQRGSKRSNGETSTSSISEHLERKPIAQTVLAEYLEAKPSTEARNPYDRANFDLYDQVSIAPSMAPKSVDECVDDDCFSSITHLATQGTLKPRAADVTTVEKGASAGEKQYTEGEMQIILSTAIKLVSTAQQQAFLPATQPQRTHRNPVPLTTTAQQQAFLSATQPQRTHRNPVPLTTTAQQQPFLSATQPQRTHSNPLPLTTAAQQQAFLSATQPQPIHSSLVPLTPPPSYHSTLHGSVQVLYPPLKKQPEVFVLSPSQLATIFPSQAV